MFFGSRMSNILGYLGVTFHITALMTASPVIICLLFGEHDYLQSFLVPAVSVFVLGTILRDRFSPENISRGEAMVASALAWIIIPAVGIFPFIQFFQFETPELHPGAEAYVDAYFESVSGYTATGLTMIPDVESAPRAILFFRSATEWFGGVGVIVLFLAVLLTPGSAAAQLYTAEGRTDRIVPSITETARIIWWIYLFYTAAGAIGLMVAGMPAWDAVNHSMTGIATGGFSIKNTSVGYYDNLNAELVCIPLMLAGAISFVVHKKLFERNWRFLFGNVEVRALLAVILLSTLAIAGHHFLVLYANDSPELNAEVAIRGRQALFQTASAVSGTGFGTADLSSWTDFAKWILTILMVIGGGYGSTSSAIKLIRFVIIFKAVIWIVRKLFLPSRAILPFRVGDKVFEEHEIMSASLYAFLYLVFLFGGALAFMSLGYNGTDSFFEVASAQGNVGLSVGISGPQLEPIGKVVLILEMLVGRLEILPFVALVGFMFGKR